MAWLERFTWLLSDRERQLDIVIVGQLIGVILRRPEWPEWRGYRNSTTFAQVRRMRERKPSSCNWNPRRRRWRRGVLMGLTLWRGSASGGSYLLRLTSISRSVKAHIYWCILIYISLFTYTTKPTLTNLRLLTWNTNINTTCLLYVKFEYFS